MPGGDELPRSISYIPYGEIFVEESDNKGVPPYRFNAKELDEETGLYYYGARYLDPTSVGWLSVDPLFEKYVGMSPYNYCAGNPVKLVDPDGQDVLNGSKLNWQEAKKEYRDFKMEVVKKYSDNFENLTFEKHSDLKEYKKMMKKLKKLDETIKKEESNAKVVAYYIDQFNKKEHEKFEMLNNLSYKNESGEIKAYHIYVYIADGNVNLSENGGAYSTMCRKKNGEFFGIVRVPSGLGKDISGIIPHEFGHHVTYASNPFYWVIHNNPDLNCQENRKHDQAILSIIWQEEWIDKIKEENSKK